jgi:L-threonylcarbamoyladenylate synthase
VLRAVGPLLVTSANLHAQETPESMRQVLDQLDGRTGPGSWTVGCGRPSPSTLVNCNLPNPAVERVGAVPADQIAKVLA